MNRLVRLAGVALATLVSGCARETNLVSLAGATMGTTYSIHFVTTTADPHEVGVRVQAVVDATLAGFNQKFSTYIPDSTIACFNATRSTDPLVVGAEFVAMVRTAWSIAERTDGAYDPTVLPLVRLYGFGPATSDTVTDEHVAAARAHIGFRKLEIVDDVRLRKTDPQLELDLSSIAKGAGVDRVSRLLTELGYPDHMVEIGGEVVCRGAKPGGEPWRIGVERPPRGEGAAPRTSQAVVELRDRAIATSGSYRNFIDSDGRHLHHVLDARTGINAPNGVVSVSVIAADCALADGLATALMIVGPEAARDIVAADPAADLQVLFLLARGASGGVTEVPIRWRDG